MRSRRRRKGDHSLYLALPRASGVLCVSALSAWAPGSSFGAVRPRGSDVCCVRPAPPTLHSNATIIPPPPCSPPATASFNHRHSNSPFVVRLPLSPCPPLILPGAPCHLTLPPANLRHAFLPLRPSSRASPRSFEAARHVSV